MPDANQQLPPHMKVIVINYDMKTQQVGIQGSIGEKLIALGMLECAKEAIINFGNEMQKKQNAAAVNEAKKIIAP